MIGTFLAGATYTRLHTGASWWTRPDLAILREDLAALHDLQITTLLLPLPWDLLQPTPARINSGVLQHFERLLDAASTAGLAVVPGLFDVTWYGSLRLPAWATGSEARRTPQGTLQMVADQPPRTVLYNGTYHHTPVRDLYGSAAMRAAQHTLIDEVVGNFAQHPSIAGWQLGAGIEHARIPTNPPTAAAWLAELAERARMRGAGWLLGSTSPAALSRRETLRPHQIAQVCDAVALHTTPVAPLRVAQPWQPDAVRFLFALVCDLCASPTTPVLPTGLALPTAQHEPVGWVSDIAFDTPIATWLADAEQQAAWLAATLSGLRADGATGVALADYADLPIAAHRLPPYSRNRASHSSGVFTTTGRAKPAAAVLREQLRSAQGAVSLPIPPTPQRASLGLDLERYWRDPLAELQRLWG